MTPRARIVSEWFVVHEEGGSWAFMDKDAWDRSSAPIKGRRLGQRVEIWDSIIGRKRDDVLTDEQLVAAGYMIPAQGFDNDLVAN